MATLLTMRQWVSRRLDQPLVGSDIPTDANNTSFWTKEDVNAWINEAASQIYGELAEIENFTLITEGSGTYTANSRSMSLRTLLSISDDPLKIEEVRDVTNVGSNDHGILVMSSHHRHFQGSVQGMGSALHRRSGTGRTWAWYGSNPMNIELYPVPTSALILRIRYVPAVPTTLSANGDIPSWLPTAHHELLVQYAVVQAKMKEENPSWRDDDRRYAEMLQRFKDSVEQRAVQSSRSVHREDLTDYLGSGG